MGSPFNFGFDQLDELLNPIVEGNVLQDMNRFKTGMDISGRFGALGAQNANTYSTQLRNQQIMDRLKGETERAWNANGPMEEPAPEDVYDPRAVQARARVLGSDLASDRELFEAQKRAGIATSEAQAARANQETERSKQMLDVDKALKEAMAKRALAVKNGDMNAYQAAQIEIARHNSARQDLVAGAQIRNMESGMENRATRTGQGAIMTWLSTQRLLNPNPTGAMSKSLRDAEGVQVAIDNVRSLTPAADAGMPATGPLGYGRVGQALSQFGAGPAEPQFYAALQGLRREIQTATAGLTVPKHEMDDILSEVAGIETAPYGREARLEQLELKMARIIEKYGKGGGVNPNLRGIQLPTIPGLPQGFGQPAGGSASDVPGPLSAPGSVGKSPSRLIRYQGRIVPFNTLPREIQDRVVQAGG